MKIPFFDQCVKYALQVKQIAGDSFKDTTMRVFQREATNPKNLTKMLSKEGIIIPTINGQLFGDTANEMVATFIVSVDESAGTVRLYVPESDEERDFTAEAFEGAWKKHNFACTTAFPADGKTYYPKLMDLSHIALPEGYEELREAIAENAHDMWARERQSEGWTLGPKRNDAKLETPDMVPYADLADSERQYDRVMAEDTLKLFMALGYKIVKA